MKLDESDRLLIEALGAILLIAGLAVIHFALALIAAGVLLILAANFAEVPDAGAK